MSVQKPKSRKAPNIDLTGDDDSIRAFVKGAVVGSLIHAKMEETFRQIGWEFTITKDGIPVLTAPSGDRWAVGVVKL